MAPKILILLGTTKGAFILEGDAARGSWEMRGPFCDGWPINHVIADPATAAIYAGGGNDWVGHDVWKSADLGASWTHSGEGLAYGEEAKEPVKAVWSFGVRNGSLYAGVKPAGLFRSDDGGQSWQHIEGLQKHPTRPDWHGGAVRFEERFFQLVSEEPPGSSAVAPERFVYKFVLWPDQQVFRRVVDYDPGAKPPDTPAGMLGGLKKWLPKG